MCTYPHTLSPLPPKTIDWLEAKAEFVRLAGKIKKIFLLPLLEGILRQTWPSMVPST